MTPREPAGGATVVDDDLSLDFSAEDVAALLAGVLDIEEEEDHRSLFEPSDELREVAQRIAGQYAEVLAGYVGALFRGVNLGNDSYTTLWSLRRLAAETGNYAQVDLLDSLDQAVHEVSAARTPRSRQIALNRVRDWIPRFADTLDPIDGERLRKLVSWDDGALPLLDELKQIRGIGPKRLARLYSAGLFSVDIVANAPPDEVAQVTGLSEALARAVVERAQNFAESERRRCADELVRTAARLRLIIERVRLPHDANAVTAARHALDELRALLRARTALEGNKP